jgi:hypothetical protein
LDGSPRSPRSPELSVNYARTQWKLALLWRGFFFRLDARPCHISAPRPAAMPQRAICCRPASKLGQPSVPSAEFWRLSRAGRPRIILILAIACGCNCCNLIAPLGADTAKEGAQLHAAAASLLQMRGAVRLCCSGQLGYRPASGSARLWLDVGRPDHLAPLLAFAGDEIPEFGGCHRHRDTGDAPRMATNYATSLVVNPQRP